MRYRLVFADSNNSVTVSDPIGKGTDSELRRQISKEWQSFVSVNLGLVAVISHQNDSYRHLWFNLRSYYKLIWNLVVFGEISTGSYVDVGRTGGAVRELSFLNMHDVM